MHMITAQFVPLLHTYKQKQWCMFVSESVEVRNDQSFLLRAKAEAETKIYCSDPEIKQQCSVGKTNLSMLKEIEASQDEHQEHIDLFFLIRSFFNKNLFFSRPIR